MFDNIFDDPIEKDCITFNVKCKFKVIDYIDGYYILIKHIYSSSKNKREINVILSDNPINISNVYSIDLDDYIIDKIYIKEIMVDFYDDDSYEIYILNDVEII